MIVNQITIDTSNSPGEIEKATQKICEYLERHGIKFRVRQVIQAPCHSSRLSPNGEGQNLKENEE